MAASEIENLQPQLLEMIPELAIEQSLPQKKVKDLNLKTKTSDQRSQSKLSNAKLLSYISQAEEPQDPQHAPYLSNAKSTQVVVKAF